jgi:RHS repeat-associated protein
MSPALAGTSDPSRTSPLPDALLAAELGPAVMADDPCEAAFGSADPTEPRKYYRARYYDPKLGRFISEDPIRLRGGINFFRYVRNNPTRWTDPTGEIFPVVVAIALIGYLVLVSDYANAPSPGDPTYSGSGPGGAMGAAAATAAAVAGIPGAVGAVCKRVANPICYLIYFHAKAQCTNDPNPALCLFRAERNFALCLEGLSPI